MTTPGRETAQTLDRGLAVLDMLIDAPSGMTITQIASRLQVGRTVVYRLVATLAARDLVSRDGEGRVRVGIGLARWSMAVHPLVRAAARPILQRLADETGATAHATIVEAGQALAVEVLAPSWTDFHVMYRVGSRHALDAGAAGRAILAGRAGDDGVVRTAGELQPGAHGAAVPVLGVTGLEASIGVVGLAPVAHDHDTALRDAAVELAAALHGPQGLGAGEMREH